MSMPANASVGTPAAPPPAGSLAARLTDFRATRWWPYALGLGMYLVLTILSRATGGRALTAQGTFNSMLILGTPVLLAGLGGLFSERAGIVNIGLEGMMVMGTWGAAFLGWKYGAWWGVLGGVLGGLLGAGIMILATVVVGVDHVIAGVAVNILAPGLARYLSSKYFLNSGGSIASSPQVKGHTGVFRAPFLAGGPLGGWKSPDLLGWIARRRWFYVSEICGALRGLLNPVPWTIVIAVLLVPLSAFVLWRTRLGLRLRSAGENPFAADSLGVPVHKMQVIALSISGMLAGFAGSVIVLETASQYRENQTLGKGFIGLAALIFGNYRPMGIAAGASLFGFADGIGTRDLNGKGTRGLLLLLVAVLVATAVVLLRRKRFRSVAVSIAVAVLVMIWFLSIKRVPDVLVNLVAPIVTLVVLTVGGRRLRPPRYDGLVWRKGMQS